MRGTFPLTIAIMLFTVVSAVIAGDSDNIEAYQFRLDGQNGAVNLALDSRTMGFGLRDLQPGDSRTTVTEDGTSITITRQADIYTLDVSGEIFEIPAMHGSDLVDIDHEVDHRVEVAHGIGNGLTILSMNPLAETRRATIRDALLAAGIVDEIEFLSPHATMSGSETIESEIKGNGERRITIRRVISD